MGRPPISSCRAPVLLDPGSPHWRHFTFIEIWRNTVLPTAPPQGSCVFTQTGSQGLTWWSRSHSEQCQPQGTERSHPPSPKGPRWAFPCITVSCPGWSPRSTWAFLWAQPGPVWACGFPNTCPKTVVWWEGDDSVWREDWTSNLAGCTGLLPSHPPIRHRQPKECPHFFFF